MTFFAHGLAAAAPTMWIVSRMNISRSATIWYGIATFILGTLNDTLDWAVSVIRKFPYLIDGTMSFADWIQPSYGIVYTWFHHYSPLWLNIIVWPIGLHNAIDSYIHLFPGYDWWNDFWWMELIIWIFCIPIILISLRRTNEINV